MNEITVVIPAYNAARCIGHAVKSLLAQTIPIDVIVVDDGSIDGTGAIVEGLIGEERWRLEAEKSRRLEAEAENGSLEISNHHAPPPPHTSTYITAERRRSESEVKLIRQENSGAYTARAKGANRATTPYVGFMDADDFAHPDMYEKLLSFAKQHDLDIAQCDYTGKADIPVDIREELFLSENDICDKIIPSRFVRGEDAVHIWDKLYRREIVQNFEPSKIMMFDDLAFNAQAFARAKRIGYLHEVLYDYDVNEGSSVRNFRLRNVEDLKEAIRFRKKYFTRYGIGEDDIAHARWICRNVRNMYLVACSAPIRDSVSRMTKVRALMDLEEVNRSFGRCGKKMRYIMMKSYLAVYLVYALKCVQRMSRRIR